MRIERADRSGVFGNYHSRSFPASQSNGLNLDMELAIEKVLTGVPAPIAARTCRIHDKSNLEKIGRFATQYDLHNRISSKNDVAVAGSFNKQGLHTDDQRKPIVDKFIIPVNNAVDAMNDGKSLEEASKMFGLDYFRETIASRVLARDRIENDPSIVDNEQIDEFVSKLDDGAKNRINISDLKKFAKPIIENRLTLNALPTNPEIFSA